MGTTWVADDCGMSALGTTGRIENLSERRELSDAAKALLADKAFGHVFRKLHEQWIAEVLITPRAGPAQDELCTRLRTLDTILLELTALLSDYREAAKRSARNG
jgi:hypothetical protein